MVKLSFDSEGCIHKDKGFRYVKVSRMTRRDIAKLKQYIKIREIELLMEDLKICSKNTCEDKNVCNVKKK